MYANQVQPWAFIILVVEETFHSSSRKNFWKFLGIRWHKFCTIPGTLSLGKIFGWMEEFVYPLPVINEAFSPTAAGF